MVRILMISLNLMRRNDTIPDTTDCYQYQLRFPQNVVSERLDSFTTVALPSKLSLTTNTILTTTYTVTTSQHSKRTTKTSLRPGSGPRSTLIWCNKLTVFEFPNFAIFNIHIICMLVKLRETY